MGGHRREKVIGSQWHIAIISCHAQGAALFFCAGINGSLSINQTRNNSGALLLTIFGLTHRHGDDPFTKTARSCALFDVVEEAIAAIEKRRGASASQLRVCFADRPEVYY
jgi:hypothetical protein